VIQLAGYTVDEKLHIAKRYLVQRQLAANGLKASQIEFADAGLNAIIDEYTREAGVRNLERQIGTACRKVARQVAEGNADGKVKISAKRARELLGKRRFFAEQRRRTKDPGVATGLAWTPVGGEVLFVEASAIPGSGKLTITGQLGDVMRESAQAALTYVRGHAKELAPELSDDWFANHDIHIHVPAGAVPKDGPSAGVAMATALSSLVTGTPVRNDVAMTGEITLTGQVLPIGGLKEKSLAAQRAGIKLVIVPDRNQGDVEEIAEHERAGLEFVYVDEIGAVLAAALERRPSKQSANSKPAKTKPAKTKPAKTKEKAAAKAKG
jgi:ATP-dependent Lon protease